ncbi:putative thioesterase family protein [Drepanopeziza brunnea f. sp. 'multigermtubi' MB_m1]|uniref:Putative thioesterase family protein n=1 Tax=Marssonina brunnea f. sp. multigermtubi (strain MB_m1) TaxID=1072389 RepID=K1WV24_MARBU|nr:putative thioesterase family protein [Drepanopeziza brunnea f. sp. 'multigermtubi' MB_m1]EKD16307.1 putative thioesterase family protein [Drepanopeziza brunnea f. sp. 'multigermtubi' MB_m1]
MADAAAARATAMKGVQAIFDRYHLIAQATNFNGFDRHVMENVLLVDASPAGTATFEFVVGERYANVNGVMHGGAAGVIFDMCTTTALGPLARPGFWDFLGGVTRALNISYLRAIPVDTTVRIHSRVLQVGKTMALIRGEMTSLDGEKVYCTAEHHKVSVPSKPEHLLYRIEWDSIWAQDRVVAGTRKARL